MEISMLRNHGITFCIFVCNTVSDRFYCDTHPLPCISDRFFCDTHSLHCISDRFYCDTHPLPCISDRFYCDTHPLPCIRDRFFLSLSFSLYVSFSSFKWLIWTTTTIPTVNNNLLQIRIQLFFSMRIRIQLLF